MLRPASAPPTERPCRDPKLWSRHQITTRQPEPCRDIKSVSRHHFSCPAPSQVATPRPGRDPPRDYPMSRHQFHVATSLLPIMGFPRRDVEIHVATSHPAAHVTTSKPCRDAVFAQPKQTRSRLHFLVATSHPTKLGPTQPSQVATPIYGRDLKLLLKASSMSQPQIQVATLSRLNQVATSVRCRDFNHLAHVTT